jgi:hypothetical protein
VELVIWTPTRDNICGTTVKSLEMLRRAAPEMGIDYVWEPFVGDSLAPRFYSVIATRFLKETDAPYLLILDSDIVFQPSDVLMILEALRSGKQVVGGFYPVANGEHFASHIGGSYNVDGGLVEAKYLANGFKGISRSILQRLVDELELPLLMQGSDFEMYPFFMSDNVKDLFLSEDWYFCDLVRRVGETCYAHTGVQLGHIKQHTLWAQDTFLRNGLDVSKGSLMDDIAEYMGTTAKALPEWDDARQVLIRLHDEHTGPVEAYYRDSAVGNYYVVTLGWFNSYRDYVTKRLGPIQGIHNKTVLDIGCGIGTALLELAGRNTRLVGYDISPAVLAFAQWRAQKLGVDNVDFVSTLPDDLSGFDVVMDRDAVIDTLTDVWLRTLRLDRA